MMQQDKDFPRSSKTFPLKEVLEEMYNKFNLSDKYTNHEIIHTWSEIVGKFIADNTEKIYIKENKLYLRISSASLRDTLFRQKKQLLELIASKFKKIYITDIVFI